jgi:SAM-dependent methyltransferase
MEYDEAYYRTREKWRDWRIEASELIRIAHIHRGSSALEIGCGGGGLASMLREQGAKIVGVDTLDAALKLAIKQFMVEENGSVRMRKPSPPSADIPIGLVRIGKGGPLPFAAASFDAILGQHVIEHLTDVGAALREWHRLLSASGRLALATPNAQYPDPAHFADSDHTHIFSKQDLSSIVESSGFIVEHCSTIFPYLTNSRVLRGGGVIAYDLFRRAPYLSERGRTIMLAARKA